MLLSENGILVRKSQETSQKWQSLITENVVVSGLCRKTNRYPDIIFSQTQNTE